MGQELGVAGLGVLPPEPGGAAAGVGGVGGEKKLLGGGEIGGEVVVFPAPTDEKSVVGLLADAGFAGALDGFGGSWGHGGGGYQIGRGGWGRGRGRGIVRGGTGDRLGGGRRKNPCRNTGGGKELGRTPRLGLEPRT